VHHQLEHLPSSSLGTETRPVVLAFCEDKNLSQKHARSASASFESQQRAKAVLMPAIAMGAQ
jgi:hypothetical protein